MIEKKIKKKGYLFFVTAVFLFVGSIVYSQSNNEEAIILPNPIDILGDSLVVQTSTTEGSQKSQVNISNLSNQTQELLGEYRLVLQQIDRLISYNEYVDRLIDDQELQIKDINQQLVDFAIVERGIVPLMLESIDTLDKFIDLDIPFLL